MGCFKCFMSKERFSKKSLKKSIKEYHDARTLASFANISFKTGKLFCSNEQSLNFRKPRIVNHNFERL